MIKLPSVLTACIATESAVHVHKTPLTILGLFSQSRSIKKKNIKWTPKPSLFTDILCFGSWSCQSHMHTYILTDANVCLKQPQIQSLSTGNKEQTQREHRRWKTKTRVPGPWRHPPLKKVLQRKLKFSRSKRDGRLQLRYFDRLRALQNSSLHSISISLLCSWFIMKSNAWLVCVISHGHSKMVP